MIMIENQNWTEIMPNTQHTMHVHIISKCYARKEKCEITKDLA